jgi:sarcosine oxidase subunit alpha
MSRVFNDIDFSNDKFPFMTFNNFKYLDTQIRILRASFTGELGYEIYVPPKYALKLWQRIFFYSRDFELVPYGTETMHLLRAEKGYIIVGQDTDGTVTPLDLNLNWMIGKKKKDFIGKRSLVRSEIVKESRKQLVGLVPVDKTYGIEEGQHVIEKEKLSTPITKPVEMLGHVTSSYFSPTLKHSVAMALIKGGKRKIGSRLYVSTSDLNTIPVEVVETSFIDPKNERMLL